jgi:hypothetical protein
LFHGHLMKMITSCSNSACNAELGAVLALSRFWLSPGVSSVLERFWKSHISQSRPILAFDLGDIVGELS